MPNTTTRAALDAARRTFREASHANNTVYVRNRAKGWLNHQPVPKDLARSRAALAAATEALQQAERNHYGWEKSYG